MAGIKIGNSYQKCLWFYDKIPKAVLAAIAVNYASSGGEHLNEVDTAILDEWRILYENGIVPQPPIKPGK